MVSLQLDDTIVAIATPPGEGAVAMVRLSGPDSLAIARRLFRPRRRRRSPPASHRVYYGHIVDPEGDRVVDEVLFVYMKAPQSYTRQDVVEITGHGGPAGVREVLRLATAGGARPAEPGELTLRAFLNGRIDLAQAEAVLDAVRARTAGALSLAAGQLDGGLSRSVAAVRREILDVLAHLEATIDFAEDDVPAPLPERLDAALAGAQATLNGLLATARAGRVHRDGVRVALAGRPNAGKSSLLNALLQHERAIVTPVPGTTRDVIEETVDVDGVPVVLLDTAGITESADAVERLGVARSRAAVATADVVVLLVDASRRPDGEDAAVAALIGQRDEPRRVLIVRSKADLAAPADGLDARVLDGLDRHGGADSADSADGPAEDAEVAALVPGAPLLRVSAATGAGLLELRAALRREAVGDSGLAVLAAHGPVVSSVRHRDALERARASLAEARAALADGLPADCLCTDLRAGVQALGEITGESVTADVLEQIFSRFCIGK